MYRMRIGAIQKVKNFEIDPIFAKKVNKEKTTWNRVNIYFVMCVQDFFWRLKVIL